MMATIAASAGCMTIASTIKYAINPSEATKVSADTKTNPIRTGRCHKTDSSTPLPKTTMFRNSDIAAADRKAESSQTSGGQGFVNTIFRLRLRRCEETTRSPIPAERIKIKKFRVETICCNELKL